MTSVAPSPVGLLQAPDLDFDAAASRIAGKVAARYSPPLAHCDLFVTEDCNHRCEYCFVKGKRPRRLTEDVARDAVDWLIRASGKMTWVSILFFGGEPLLEFELIRFLVGYSRDRAKATGKEARFSMTTNGTLMTEEMARYLAEHGIAYLLSIDGRRETHDAHRKMLGGGSSFEAVMSRLPLMKRYQPWQGSRVTLHPSTIGALREDVEFLYSRGINQFIIGPATGIEWTDDDLAEYERQMLLVTEMYVEKQRKKEPFRMTLYEKDLEGRDIRNEWGCGAGRGRICISVAGELYGCAKILGVDALKDTHRLGDVWTGITNLRGRRELLNTHPSARPACATCEFAADCTGGCPAVNYEATGSLLTPAPLECRLAPIVKRIREHYRARSAA
jgi:uncharacterized protein